MGVDDRALKFAGQMAPSRRSFAATNPAKVPTAIARKLGMKPHRVRRIIRLASRREKDRAELIEWCGRFLPQTGHSGSVIGTGKKCHERIKDCHKATSNDSRFGWTQELQPFQLSRKDPRR